MNDRNHNRTSERAPAPADPIEERIIDQNPEGQEEVVEAAREAFNRDQEDPDHPARVERRKGDVEDPSHSKGSQA